MPEFAKSILKGLGLSVIATAVICLLTGALSLWVNIPDGALEIFSVAILLISTYSAGYFATQFGRSKGLLQGVLCGLSIFAMVLVLSALTKEFEFRDITFVKAGACVVGGAAGGVVGVNTKKTKLRH